ncbi:hypothetical protein JJB98_27985 [Bradyrhizobium diazoefficiens]|nr:hypothetical protein [Bradyrhizobium diazoefficiens]QQO23500.1 hypothetical protein JJB98_27985 [Bradyrhizobium diazoefficiens]
MAALFGFRLGVATRLALPTSDGTVSVRDPWRRDEAPEYGKLSLQHAAILRKGTGIAPTSAFDGEIVSTQGDSDRPAGKAGQCWRTS